MRETHDKLRMEEARQQAKEEQLADVTKQINKGLNMPVIDDKHHLEHPVDLSDTKAQGSHGEKASEATAAQAGTSVQDQGRSGLEPQKEGGGVGGATDAVSVRTRATKLTKSNLRTLEDRNPYSFIEKALGGAK